MANAIVPKPLTVEDMYPAVLELFERVQGPIPEGRVLDVPAGQGAFAAELLARGCNNIDCVDVNESAFVLRDPRIRFWCHDVIRPLPFADAHFDQVFSVEGIEHFENPWIFVKELCRVLKPGGRLFLTTPNTFSVDARLKYLVSGYFPRFRPLMQEPDKVLQQPVDDAHISPIYFWQLNFFLQQGGVEIEHLSTNAMLRKPQWVKRAFEQWIARIIRRNITKRGFPNPGITSEEVLFGDCLIVAGRKRASAAT
jgi:SAM-dependent methyltransferase